MSDRAPYSRVYWTVRNDPRLAGIYSDDHHWAAWNRLLLAADMAWPAPADLPATARRASVAALEAAGVIELLPGGMFTFHGLDAERGRRREAAKRDPNGTQLGTKRDPVASSRAPAPRLGSSSLGSSLAREGLPSLTPEAITALEERTGQTWSMAGDKQLGEYDRLVGAHGLAAVLAAMDTVRDGKRLTARQLVWPAMKLLEPLPDPRKAADAADARADAVRRERANRVSLLRARHNNGLHADDPDDACPECRGAA